jgi:hypothetical protein
MPTPKARYRKRLRSAEAKGISDRFSVFVRKVYGSWSEFERRTGTRPTTYAGWRKRTSANLPGIHWLIPIAQESGLDLNWLLLGEGRMLRHRWAATPDEALLARIEAELRATEGVSRDEADEVWRRMLRDKEDVWRLSVEGVRAAFRENIQGLRLAAEAFAVVRQATEGHLPPERIYDAVREAIQRRLGGLLDKPHVSSGYRSPTRGSSDS